MDEPKSSLSRYNEKNSWNHHTYPWLHRNTPNLRRKIPPPITVRARNSGPFPRSALSTGGGGLRSAILTGRFTEGAAETAGGDLRRRRLNRRRNPPGAVAACSAVGSAPLDGVDRPQGLDLLQQRLGLLILLICRSLRLRLILLIFLLGDLIELSRQEPVVPHQPRRALPPERHCRSLQTSHGFSLAFSLLSLSL